jgi:hypothetical protein
MRSPAREPQRATNVLPGCADSLEERVVRKPGLGCPLVAYVIPSAVRPDRFAVEVGHRSALRDLRVRGLPAKVTNRRGYGIRRFEAFRRRILLAFGLGRARWSASPYATSRTGRRTEG